MEPPAAGSHDGTYAVEIAYVSVYDVFELRGSVGNLFGVDGNENLLPVGNIID